MAVALLLAMSVGLLFNAWLIRTGRLQKWPRRYYAATGASLYVQRGWLGLVPFAGTLLCWALAIILGPLPGVWGYLGVIAVPASLVWFGLGFWWMKHPPEWIKPDWMKEAEGRPAPDDRPGGRALVEVPRWQYYLGWGLVSALLILAAVLGWPGPLLTGIGVALMFLAGCRPEPRRDRLRR